MKKTIGICFFADLMLLCTLGLYFLWKPEAQKPFQETQIAEEIEMNTNTETQTETTEIMSIQKTYVYRILARDDRLAVYESGSEEMLFETNIKVSDLDKALQERVREGIDFMNENELYDFLESYSS